MGNANIPVFSDEQNLCIQKICWVVLAVAATRKPPLLYAEPKDVMQFKHLNGIEYFKDENELVDFIETVFFSMGESSIEPLQLFGKYCNAEGDLVGYSSRPCDYVNRP